MLCCGQERLNPRRVQRKQLWVLLGDLLPSNSRVLWAGFYWQSPTHLPENDMGTAETQKKPVFSVGERRNIWRAHSRRVASYETLGLPLSSYLKRKNLCLPNPPFGVKDAGYGMGRQREFVGCARECRSKLETQHCCWIFRVGFFHFFFLLNCNSLPHHPSCRCDSYAFSNVTLSLNSNQNKVLSCIWAANKFSIKCNYSPQKINTDNLDIWKAWITLNQNSEWRPLQGLK